MATKRVEYVDYIRGLCVTWVVWYHTTHPDFVEYSFRIPLFFFASGIFFRPYPWKKFWRKKFNQLIVPFLLFYLIYYIYLIVTNALKFHNLSSFDYSCIFDVFGTYSATESFVVNPPLWFICALINLQLLLYISSKIIKNKWILLALSFIIASVGLFYIQHYPTPFMFGRSLRYFVYYVSGYIFGKTLIEKLDNNNDTIKILVASLSSFIIILTIKFIGQDFTIYTSELLNCIEIFCIILLLFVLFKNIYKVSIMYPFKYFGVNSYIVFGMHEIYHTTIRIIMQNIFGEVTITLGIIQTIITLSLLWPTIWLFNKYIPKLVGKKEMISVPNI